MMAVLLSVLICHMDQSDVVTYLWVMTEPTQIASPAQPLDPARALRDRLLDAALDEAAFSGWNQGCVTRAREAAGLNEGEAMLAAPRGAIDLVDAWFDRAERAMERAVIDCEPGTKIRVRATVAVKARLEAMAPHKESLRRAALFLALPNNVSDAARIGWRAADRAWKAMGDPSTDFNFYTKRMLLTGVHATTLAYWLQDDTEDSASTWGFLDRRIENIMGIEKVKAQIGGLVDKIPDPLGVLTLLRYGRQPRP
jgi:ubiquinone biosynthesis protein COQ9